MTRSPSEMTDQPTPQTEAGRRLLAAIDTRGGGAVGTRGDILAIEAEALAQARTEALRDVDLEPEVLLARGAMIDQPTPQTETLSWALREHRDRNEPPCESCITRAAQARTEALDVLREAVETEWYNGNIDEKAYRRLARLAAKADR